jgi:hypothetical protein
MKAGDIIYARLQATSAVAAIVSTRIYPVDAPLEVDLPCIWYDVTLGEALDGSAPMAAAQVQVGCLAHDEATAHDLAAAVDGSLDGLTRTSGGTWLRALRRLGRQENRDTDNNLWSVLLVYGGTVTF